MGLCCPWPFLGIPCIPVLHQEAARVSEEAQEALRTLEARALGHVNIS